MTPRVVSAEEGFALALKLCEPEKLPTGSRERREWLRLMLHIQTYLIDQRMNWRSFVNLLLGPPVAAEADPMELWVHRYPKGVDHVAELNPEWQSKQAPGVGRCRKCRRIIDLVPG